MRQTIPALLLLVATLAAMPVADAEHVPATIEQVKAKVVDPLVGTPAVCSQEPGYQVCPVETERCSGDVRYYQHDSFYTYYAECQVGNMNCSYYSHSLYGKQVGPNCHIVDEASASSDQPTCEPAPGYRDCTVSAAGCTAGARYYQDINQFEPVASCPVTTSDAGPCQRGTVYDECHADLGFCSASLYYVHHDSQFHSTTDCLPTTATSSAWDPCTEYPGYEECRYPAGPCTVITRYFYHDAFYQIDYECEKPDGSASGAGQPDCTDYPGYRVCTYDAGPCTLTTTTYHHDAFTVYELGCLGKGIVQFTFPSTGSAATTTSAADPVTCHGPLDGYQYCEVDLGRCHAGETYQAGVGTSAHAECRYIDAKGVCGFGAFYGPTYAYYKCSFGEGEIHPPAAKTASAAQPVECHGPLDGYQYCTVTVGPCSAGETYDRGAISTHSDCDPSGIAVASTHDKLPVHCHGPSDGYQYCEVYGDDCHAGETIEGDTWIHAECQPTDGQSFCGVNASFFPLSADYRCFSREGSVEPRVATSSQVACKAYPETEPIFRVIVDCDPVYCDINFVEDGFPACRY